MKGKVLEKILSILLIITLTMVEFIFLTFNFANALYEELEQQNIDIKNSNIKFDVYFKNGEERIHTKQANISKGDNLYIKLNINNTGSLNDTKIKINNANFKIQRDKINNSYIKEINYDNNEILLNQIIYGDNIEIEVPIEFSKQDMYSASYFNMENEITLSGKYRESSEKDIDSTIKIRTIWTDETDTTLNVDTEKYFSLGEEGTLLQQCINSSVNDNKLPKESEKITVSVPVIENEKPKEINIVQNGNKIDSNRYKYNEEENLLEIQGVEPASEEQKINWNSGTDKYKIIYLYDSKLGENPRYIDINVKAETKIYTIDNIYEKQDIRQEQLTKRGTSTNINGSLSSSVYKGYLYANSQDETNYSENYNIEISQVKTLDKIQVRASIDSFVYSLSNDNEQLISTNESIYYKATKVNRDNMFNILGNDGNINILNENGEIIGTINKDSQVTENGEFVFNYNNFNFQNIIIETTKPIKEGNLDIKNEKAIKGDTGYNKEQLRKITNLQSETKITNNLEQVNSNIMRMELLDTKTEAVLTINNNNLTTLETNKNIELIATFKTLDNKYDLYKNVDIQIELPLGIQDISINSINKKYDDQLEIQSPTLITLQDGRKAIKLKLIGEQTKFCNNISEGMQIIINSDITFDKTTPTNVSKIIMNYSNENGINKNYSSSLNLNINSKYGMTVYTKVSDYNKESEVIETIEDKTMLGKLDTEEEGRTAKLEREIINNYEKEITDISIIGNIPNIGEENINNKNLKSTFISNLKENVVTDNAESKIYYSEKSDIAVDSEEWQEQVDNIEAVKSYKVVLPENKLQSGQSLNIERSLEIPENLSYDQSSYETMQLSYNYEGQMIKEEYATSLSTGEDEMSNQANGISESKEIEGIGEIEIASTSGGTELRDGQSIFEGQAIQYVVKIKNNTETDLTNVKLKIDYPNANIYDEKVIQEPNSLTGEIDTYTFTFENEEITSKTFETERIEKDETITIKYQISAKENIDKLEGSIKISTDNVGETEIMKTSNEVKESKIKATLETYIPKETTLYKEDLFVADAYVKNISDSDIENVILNMDIPNAISLYEVDSSQNGEYEVIKNTDKQVQIKINSIKKESTVNIKIRFQVEKEEKEELNLIYNVLTTENTYTSNTIIMKLGDNIKSIKAKQVANITDKYVKTGDKLTYTIMFSNDTGVDYLIHSIEDYVPEAAAIDIAYYEINGNRTEITQIEDNEISLTDIELESGKTMNVVIETTIDASLSYETEITNSPIALVMETGEIEINEISHTLKDTEQQDSDTGDNNKGDEEKENNTISGEVWIDSNKDGVKDLNESKVNSVTVKLIGVDSSEKQSTSTDQNGKYIFENVENGQYMVVFEYDTVKYTTTIYKANGVDESVNSDVNAQTLNNRNIGLTDIINIKDNSVSGVNAGLVENKTFDLKLDKYINKVIVQNADGTQSTEYTNEKLAKVEIGAKRINNSTVIVEYRIDITNEGEIPGYANEIIDYMPNDMKFSSELNKTWYTTNSKELKNTELKNTIIKPGETKSILLVLTKSMTENNTGTVINTAEITKSSNDLNIKDKDSIEGNKVEGEDDISTAEVLISVRTGVEIIIAVTTVLIILIVIATIVYLMRKKED